MGKTWWQYKVCKNDTCYPPVDSLFFDGSFDDFKYHYKGYNGKDLTCITPIALKPYKRNDGTSTYLRCSDCIPLICFIDTLLKGNFYPIYMIGLGVYNKGELLFISDSEFVINRHSMVRVDSVNIMKIVYSYYYRSVHLTE